MKHKSAFVSFLILLSVTMLNACRPADDFNQKVTKNRGSIKGKVEADVERKVDRERKNDIENKSLEVSKPSYMIYYGVLDESIIETAKQYGVCILHPKMGNITREQVQEIQESGTLVLGYISIGEDLRTAGMTPEEMLEDKRFTADGTGPRVDPRPADAAELDHIDILGKESPGGTGYASYYLDDNDFDGKPDINVNFNCAFTNIGDPAWFEELDKMTMDGIDKIPGIREILTDEYGRGLGCDGLFLDTIDTCAPNYYTDDSDSYKTRFEWTAPGVASFMKHLKEAYPDKLILQNRGIFFYNPQLPHYKYAPRAYVDYLMFESYMLDSNTTSLFNENFYADNKYNYAPKLIAEAARPDGFKILSLGYAEGPEEYRLKDTLLGKSTVGLDILMEDMNQAQNNAGFMHYITDGGVTLVNDFVITHEEKEDDSPPVWSSVYNDSTTYPYQEPKPRVGIGQAEPIPNGMIVRWDVALDKNDVIYTLYYQNKPFDFENDPDLKEAKALELVPEVGEGYINGAGADIYPYQTAIEELNAGETYYFLIRAKDDSENQNEEKNTVVKEGVPLEG